MPSNRDVPIDAPIENRNGKKRFAISGIVYYTVSIQGDTSLDWTGSELGDHAI